MKKSILLTVLALATAGLIFIAGVPGSSTTPDMTANFKTGAPQHQSIGELAFGPQGILFYADSPGASIYALDAQPSSHAANAGGALNVSDVAGKFAQKLGATAADIAIQDMVVEPSTSEVYFSLRRGEGTIATWHLMRVGMDGAVSEVALDNVRYSKFDLATAPAEDATDRRGRSLRSSSITDLAFSNGQVYVAGISNEEFASGFRQIAFPFGGEESLTTLEIYHVSHGQYETNAPIRTFVPYSTDSGNYIVAGYTCTPLVLFPMDNLENGRHVRGRTVAELGNRNRPLDIIPYTDGSGNPALMIANSSYSAMKVDPGQFASQSHLDQPLAEGEDTKGVNFESTGLENVMHMDNLNDNYLVMLQETDSGTLDLRSVRK